MTEATRRQILAAAPLAVLSTVGYKADQPLCNTCRWWVQQNRERIKAMGFREDVDWGRCAVNPPAGGRWSYTQEHEWCRMHPAIFQTLQEEQKR